MATNAGDSGGYAKWSTPNTSTVPNDPANQINRAKGKPNSPPPATSGLGASVNAAEGKGLAPTISQSHGEQSITDGKTKVTTSVPTGSGHDFARMAREGYKTQHGVYPPCLNSYCRSYGKPHPNCLCYGNGSDEEWANRPEYNSFKAHGGMVCIPGPHHESCEHFADGGQVIENQKFQNQPQDSLDHAGLLNGLLHLLTKLGDNGKHQDPYKHFQDYIDSSKRGHKSIDSHMPKLIGPEKLDIESGNEDVEGLKNHLNDIELNPSKALDIGGQLGSILPMHSAALGAKTANALNYFQGLKPKQAQPNPLDKVVSSGKMKEAQYNRQLGIAQNPMLIMHHAKQGTLQPQDLKTLHTIYPSLGQSMTSKAGEALIDAKNKGTPIPYKTKQGLSRLLGQPLDTTMDPMAMQAIMRANMPSQPAQTQKQPKKASGTELKQVDKVTDLYATQSQQRQLDRKS
jgi:hypothetical protein